MNEIITCGTENEQNKLGYQSMICGNKDIELKRMDVVTEDFNLKTESHNNEEIAKNDGNKVLKKKVTENGVTIGRVLSEGEASSGFETVSSIDSKVDFDDLELSSFDRDDYNIVVKIKNELAFQIRNRPDERIYCRKTRSKSSGRQRHKLHSFLNDFTNQRLGSSRDSKYQRRKNVDKNYNYDRRNRESSERKNFDYSRQQDCSNKWSTNRDQVRKARRNRWDVTDSRSRRSRSKEHTGRLRGSRSPKRIVRNRSSNFKDTKAESKCSGSFDRNSAKSASKRRIPPRQKRGNSISKASSSSVWKQNESQNLFNKIKKDEINNDKKIPRNSFPCRKKERTSFSVEVKRKLNEAGRSKNSHPESNAAAGTNASEKELTLISALPPAKNQSSNPSFLSEPSVQGAFYPVPCTPIPTVSVNNLPLVAGSTGLPLYITPIGEQIPHDMDGRPIPVGPNGYYLPLDPTGRIFAHIVSPWNQAVPIHLMEDGILRLPNSEPVPFGPMHRFPVNVDGRVIPIGPDSKPLFPCPGLPKKPPLKLEQMVDSSRNENAVQTLPPPSSLQLEDQEAVKSKILETQIHDVPELPAVDLSLLNHIQNSSGEINKAELLNKNKKKVQEKSKDILKCKETEKNLRVNPSKRGVKRSVPVKLLQKKTSKDDPNCKSSDIILEADDSDSALKTVMEPNKGLNEEIILNSDEEQDILEIICVEKISEVQNLKANFKDYITEKIQQAIQLLNEKNHKPPVVGRFIISDVKLVSSVHDSPNESPLLRNRVQLPFLIPNSSVNDQPVVVKKSKVNFQFLPQKTENHPNVKQINPNPVTFPAFTFDFAVQCDFTSEIIRNLSFKVSQLENEVARLKRINVNLFDDYRNVQTAKQNKAHELKKALLEIQEKNNEIRSLKGLNETPK